MPRPAEVRKRDGRTEAFDFAKLARSFFRARREHAPERAAAHAAELARAVAHFAALDDLDPMPSADLRRHALTALRELGHPETARRYAAGPEVRAAAAPAPAAELPARARAGSLRLARGTAPARLSWTTVNAAAWAGETEADFLRAAQRALAAARGRARRVVLCQADLAAAGSGGAARVLGERLGWLLAACGPRATVRLTPAPTADAWAQLAGGPLFGPPAHAAARLADCHAGLACVLALLEPAWAWLPLLEGALTGGAAWDDALARGCRVAAWHVRADAPADGLAVARVNLPAGTPAARAALAAAALRGAVAFREALRRRGVVVPSAALAFQDRQGAAAATELVGYARRAAHAARLPLVAGVPLPAYADAFAAAGSTLSELAQAREESADGTARAGTNRR